MPRTAGALGGRAAALLRCTDKQLWRRIEFYVEQARVRDDMSGVHIVGIDETSLRRGQNYITVVHDLDTKRLLFATEGREHQTVIDFVADLKASRAPHAPRRVLTLWWPRANPADFPP